VNSVTVEKPPSHTMGKESHTHTHCTTYRYFTGLCHDPQQRPRFNPRSVCTGFMVDKVAPREVVLQVLQSYPVSTIQTAPHTHSFIQPTPMLCNLSNWQCH